MNNNQFPQLNRPNSSEPVKKLPLPPKGGKVSGFPSPPKKPAVSNVEAGKRVYSPPGKFPIPPTAAEPVKKEEPAPPLEDELETLIISDDELQDVYDHRGARRVKFLPEEKIYRIATSEDPVVRKELAINPATPPNILKILAQDVDEQVREEVVFNPSTPKEVYEMLANDSSTWVIEALIKNTRTPYNVLERLNVGNDPYLKKLLSERGL